jgi:hypothetical protein
MARWDVAARRYIEIVSSLQIAGKMLSLRGHYKPGSTSKWRPNYGLDHYSLIKPKNSLIAKFHSLLGGKKYPVRSGRELGFQAFDDAAGIYSSAGAALRSRM